MDRLVSKINKLIVKIAKGDSDAIEELYSLTGRILLTMAKKYSKDSDSAEDAVSETYCKVVRNARSFDPSKNGLNWLYKIVKNETLNVIRKNARIVNCDFDEESPTKDFVDDVLEKIIVREAIERLSDEEKQLIYHRYWEGLSFEELSEKYRKTISTVYDNLKRILKKLKKYLK